MRNISSLARCVRGAIPGLPRPLAALGLLLATAGAAQAQTPASFAPVVTYPTGGTISLRVVAGDLNGDGRPDAVTANITSNNVSVFLGSGNGIFGAATRYLVAPSGIQVQGLTLADVNADGRLDIVTANNGNNTVSVLLGQAGGTFGTYTSYSTGSNTGPRNAALADLNGDGVLDIVTGNSDSANASVLLGLGGGAFGAPTLYPTAGQNFDVALGDVNGDGRLDIVTPSYTANAVSVLPGQAGGTFGTFASYSTGTSAQSVGIRLGDVNTDGRLDIVVGNQNSTLSVLLGQAGGTLAPTATYSTVGVTSVYAVSIGDVNGDGRPDLVAGNFQGSLIGVLLGQASGFGAVTTLTGGSGPQGVTLSDVNSDGKLDILTANRNDNTLGVLLNTAVYAAPTLTTISPNSGPVGTTVTLTGTNLGSATGVSFNGTAATTFAVVSATTLTATVPTGATTGNVTVTAGGGTSNGVVFTVIVPVPTVTTSTPTNVTSNAATLGGTVTAQGGATVTERGVAYSATVTTPTTSDPKFSLGGTALGAYSQTVTALAPGTTYYARAYALNSGGTAYGAVVTFTTPAGLATVTTTTPSGIASTGAVVGGTVAATGGAPVTERGIVYVAGSGIPTTASSKVVVGSGTGSFSYTLAGLLPGTQYSVRAYAISTAGTSYGDQASFTTMIVMATVPSGAAAGLVLYPNPVAATQALTLELPAALSRYAATAVLSDALGRVACTQQLPASGGAVRTLAVVGLAPGLYVLRLHTPAGELTSKLTVE